jgi:hypothetical protein
MTEFRKSSVTNERRAETRETGGSGGGARRCASGVSAATGGILPEFISVPSLGSRRRARHEAALVADAGKTL